jgi:hypothetical protein
VQAKMLKCQSQKSDVVTRDTHEIRGLKINSGFIYNGLSQVVDDAHMRDY